ncbi:MAG: glycosyltransferase, partial [Verrucomicrobiota bacterium]|nr:glycosyltransferase [Verrucomicrobiota bacterium]
MEQFALFIAVSLWAAGFLILPRLWRRCTCAPADSAADVSVIIPARNEARNLPVLLNSLTSQPAKVREIIVVDDGSTDNTAGVAREHG